MAGQSGRDGGGVYSYSSQPRVVRRAYKKQRENCLINFGNMMFDKRIIRGNTYSLCNFPNFCMDEFGAPPKPKKPAKRRHFLEQLHFKYKFEDVTVVPPVDGREHKELQTDIYVEELIERKEEAEAGSQTDIFLDRPPSPLFVPVKSGLDVETQIYEGELFDFDVEVAPILEVLVEKTMEQSLLEVLEEEELATLREQQHMFEELRNAELAEQQRLEEQERRHREEKERRIQQAKEKLENANETMGKMMSHLFATSYLNDLVPAVFGSLSDAGYFYDPVERDVEQEFFPWLMKSVQERLNQVVHVRAVLDEVIEVVVQERRLLLQVQLMAYQMSMQKDEKKDEEEEEEDEEDEYEEGEGSDEDDEIRQYMKEDDQLLLSEMEEEEENQ